MKRKFLLFGVTLSFAFMILFSSVFQASAIEYQFAPSPKPIPRMKGDNEINPTHFFWPVKAMGQKISMAVSPTYLEQAKKSLAYSKERIEYSKELFDMGEVNEGVSVMVKASQYLENAYQKEKLASKSGEDTKDFLYELFDSSVFHKETIDEISKICPDQARAMVVKTGDLPLRIAAETKAAIPSKR